MLQYLHHYRILSLNNYGTGFASLGIMELYRIAEILDHSYNKAQLDGSLKNPVRIFVTKNENFLKSEGIPNRVLVLAREKRFTKKTLADLCAIPFRNATIFNKFRQTLVDDVQKVLDALVWVKSMHESEIRDKLGVSVCLEVRKHRYGNHYTIARSLKPEFNIFQSVNHSPYYTAASYSLFLSPELRKLLIRYYDKPDNANFNPIPEEHLAKTDYVYAQGERDIYLELNRILAYISQKQVKVTAKGRPVASTLGKMQRKLNLKEFFKDIDKEDKALKNLRTKLIAGIMVTISGKQSDPEIAGMLRRHIFQENFINRFDSAAIILAHIKGMGHLDGYDFRSVEVEAFNLLRHLPVDKWVSIQNIADYATYNILDLTAIHPNTAGNKLYFEYKDEEAEEYYTRYERKHYITTEKYEKTITRPYMKGLFFFFAAFGLVKIAYDQVDVSELGLTAFSPYDGLKYVQLTPLGFYVTGNTNTYIPPKGSTGSEILLSKDSLTILIQADDDIAPTLLEPYAERISDTRFRTDFRFFLKECRSQKELDGKIKLFKQFISNELPPNWEQFFTELRQKIDPLIPIQEMKIFKIPADNPKLIQLIARDAQLKKLVVKAEGYHVLIPKGNMSRFKKRLQDFGYFLTS